MKTHDPNGIDKYIPNVYTFVKIFTMKSLSLKLDDKVFDDTEEMLSLYNAMDTIRNKYGELSIQKAASMGAKTIGRFQNPFNGEPPVLLAHRKQ